MMWPMLLERHFVRRAFAGCTPALVVNLGGRYVAVAEQLFYLHDVYSGVEEERGRRSPQRMRRVDAFHHLVSVR